MKKFFKEFKQFITRGNVIDLAVGVIVGGAFTGIVTALVKDVFTPLINYVIYLCCGGNTNAFTNLDLILIPAKIDEQGVIIKEATVLAFSDLISAIINFLLVAIVLFIIIKAVNNAHKVVHAKEELEKKKLAEEKAKKEKEEAERKASEPIPLSTSEALLVEIRDLLKKEEK